MSIHQQWICVRVPGKFSYWLGDQTSLQHHQIRTGMCAVLLKTWRNTTKCGFQRCYESKQWTWRKSCWPQDSLACPSGSYFPNHVLGVLVPVHDVEVRWLPHMVHHNPIPATSNYRWWSYVWKSEKYRTFLRRRGYLETKLINGTRSHILVNCRIFECLSNLQFKKNKISHCYHKVTPTPTPTLTLNRCSVDFTRDVKNIFWLPLVTVTFNVLCLVYWIYASLSLFSCGEEVANPLSTFKSVEYSTNQRGLFLLYFFFFFFINEFIVAYS